MHFIQTKRPEVVGPSCCEMWKYSHPCSLMYFRAALSFHPSFLQFSVKRAFFLKLWTHFCLSFNWKGQFLSSIIWNVFMLKFATPTLFYMKGNRPTFATGNKLIVCTLKVMFQYAQSISFLDCFCALKKHWNIWVGYRQSVDSLVCS